MTDSEKILTIMPAIARLNCWARLAFADQLDMHEMPQRIYGWKRSAIAAAMKLGMATQRIVAVPRSCKTCKGTGEYRWENWNDEYDVRFEDCRRCAASGQVVLRFVESRIADRWTFHTPRPKWDLGVFTPEDFEAATGDTDWTPEQPGAPLGRLELIRLINQIETVILAGRQPEARMGSATEYTLHMGELPFCWICGALNVRYSHDIWRGSIGLRWKAGVCDACEITGEGVARPPVWPMNLHPLRNERDNFPAWHDRAPLPPMAHTPEVREWLERRQIYTGCYPPGDYAYTSSGDFVRIKSTTALEAIVEVVDRHGFTGEWNGRQVCEWVGWLHEAELRLAQSTLRPSGRNPYVHPDPWGEVKV